MSEQRNVGVIGLGNIGGAIADNLVADGHRVAVFDIDRPRAEAIAGARVASSAGEIGELCEVAFTSLPSPAAMQAVAQDWLRGAARGAILADLSTNAPSTVREVGRTLEEAGRHLLEVPLTGGAPGARARMLVFMVGGEASVFERCRPLLEKLGRATFHLGPLGCGNTAKLVNSLMAFAATWASLEGLAVAAKAGLDLRAMIDVIRTGGAGNFFTDRMVDGINERNRPPHFALRLAAKDAGLLLDLGRETGVPMPVAAEVAQALVAAVAAGLGERDFTDWVELIERQAQVKIRLGAGV